MPNSEYFDIPVEPRIEAASPLAFDMVLVLVLVFLFLCRHRNIFSIMKASFLVVCPFVVLLAFY